MQQVVSLWFQDKIPVSELPERNEPDPKHNMNSDKCKALRRMTGGEMQPEIFSNRSISSCISSPNYGLNQAQDAVHKLSTAHIDKYFAAMVPSCGGCTAQELVSAGVFDAEEAAGDEPKDWVEE